MNNKKYKLEREVGKSFLYESYRLLTEGCGCDDPNHDHDDSDYSLDYLNDDHGNLNHQEYSSHPGYSGNESLGNDHGHISKDDLFSHFDLDNDGVVTMNDYAQHVDFHCEYPELLDPYLDMKYSEMDSTPCPNTYEKVADNLIGDTESIRSMLGPIMKVTGTDCPASAAKALSDVTGLVYNKFK